MQAVAARADLAAGSISQYFDSKKRLLTAVLEHLSGEFEQAWRGALVSNTADPAQRPALARLAADGVQSLFPRHAEALAHEILGASS